ncbi:MAG: DUF1688 family protein [Halobacteriovoraceae bacterium]|nr:DUF1688 family protein [Halobacteriovoraceae bacterium]MCB9095222.1 DUF1688 family protein [Halobacteriovoraceae bacterium]
MSNLETLTNTSYIRSQAQKIYQLCQEGKTSFILDESRLNDTADLVIENIKKNYPKGNIPYHGRINHLNAGSTQRTRQLPDQKTLMDLIFVSTLVDAGTGNKWSFQENDRTFEKSEGLAVASYHFFKSGYVTENGVLDAGKLSKLKTTAFEKVFQVTDENRLNGTKDRVKLLNKLGQVLLNSSTFPNARPSDLAQLMQTRYGDTFSAKNLLKEILLNFHQIWPERKKVDGINLSDVWFYPLASDDKEDIQNWIPFHKLSQWLTYSLIEVFDKANFKITNIDELTGLPEYRNGGLFIDTGVIKFEVPEDQNKIFPVDSKLVIEWRALTVILLDKISELIKTKMGDRQLNLAKILEGGTWSTGRELAMKRRNGTPPLRLALDSTVF